MPVTVPPCHTPLKLPFRFSTNARLASFASSEFCKMPPALDVSTIVVSNVLSKAARMTRLLTHCTSGGLAMIFSHSSRVVSSSFSEGTRWLSIPHSYARSAFNSPV